MKKRGKEQSPDENKLEETVKMKQNMNLIKIYEFYT